MNDRGRIRAEDAYAQGKMLNHNSWAGKLRGLITPSDVDMFFDNRGSILFCELSKSHSDWAQVSTGQRIAYRNLTRYGYTSAALLRHSVPTELEINTRDAIDEFSIMYYCDGDFVTTPVWPGSEWPRFVDAWMIDSMVLIKSCADKWRESYRIETEVNKKRSDWTNGEGATR